MKICTYLICALFGLSTLSAADRIVSAAGSITETIYALGAEDALVAVDVSSVFPAEADALPKIGYDRQLSAEGILSMEPSVVMVTENAGPPEVIKQLEAAGVNMLVLPAQHTPEAAKDRILKIGEALHLEEAAGKLAAKLQTDLDVAKTKVEGVKFLPKVLFIYARGGGVMNVSGTDTSADAIITLAGAENAIQAYEGYKPLTAEGAVAAAPDVILVTTRGLESSGGIEGLLKQPGLVLTPAGKDRRIVVLDDLYLLGFGPRLGEAVRDLCDQLHPQTEMTQKN